MLKVVPKSWWSYTFSVTDGGRPVAQAVNRSCWRDKAELQVEGAAYTARRDKSSFILESAGAPIARAERPRRWFREFVIEHSGRRYLLRRRSAFRRQYLLLEGSTRAGSITPGGLFGRKAAVELPPDVPLHLQIFIIWIVMTLWKHDDNAGAAVVGG